jgi:putative polyketide hydroxylase
VEDILSDQMQGRIDHNTNSVPVLIVGGGPAGLVTAITLARYGVESLLVERRERLSDQPRATAISVRSMELLRSWGLEAQVLEGALDVSFLGRIGETLTGPGSTIPLGFPTAEEAAVVSPVAPVSVPQDHLEPVLLRHLESLRPGSVRFGHELADLAAGQGGVLARIRDVRSERLETVAARYLVGADGVRSSVREALGVRTHGPGVVAHRVATLFRAPLWDWIEPPHHVLYPITHPEAEGTFVPAGRADRWVYAFTGGAGAPPPEEEAAVTRIRTAAGIPELGPRIEHIGRVQYAADLAERFRTGSAFLAGDAAHRVTPRGGTGMNTAIHDGHDIGWKLAWVLKGWAGDELLDTYEQERRPVAEHNMRRSTDPNGSVREAADELQVDLGGRIPHAWVGAGAERVSTLDLLSPGLTIFTTADAPRARVDADDGAAPVTVRELPPLAASALGIGPGLALHVRPDGVPAGRCARSAMANSEPPRPTCKASRAPRSSTTPSLTAEPRIIPAIAGLTACQPPIGPRPTDPRCVAEAVAPRAPQRWESERELGGEATTTRPPSRQSVAP